MKLQESPKHSNSQLLILVLSVLGVRTGAETRALGKYADTRNPSLMKTCADVWVRVLGCFLAYALWAETHITPESSERHAQREPPPSLPDA